MKKRIITIIILLSILTLILPMSSVASIQAPSAQINNNVITTVTETPGLNARGIQVDSQTGENPPSMVQGGDSYEFVTKWGGEGPGEGQLYHPYALAVGKDGNIIVADTWNSRVQVFSGSGAPVMRWGSEGTGDFQFKYPRGIAVDSAGNIYVSDCLNNRIMKYTSDGRTLLTNWEGPADGKFSAQTHIAVDTDGNVYVSDSNNHRIQKFTSEGVFIKKWGELGSGNGQFNIPYGIAVDKENNVYVVDRNNYRIQKFSSNGDYKTQWGSFGTGDGMFNYTYGIAVDKDNNVFVADNGNNRIQKFSSEGTFITKWGEIGPNDGQFIAPGGLAVDTDGNVYVTELSMSRIHKFRPVASTSPTITSITPASTPNTAPVVSCSITGTNFKAGAVVTLTRAGSTNITGTITGMVSPTTIPCLFQIMGATAGAWNVVVTNTDGQTGVLENGFTITGQKPTVTAITPSSIQRSAPIVTASITGTNFQNGASVNLTRIGSANVTGTSVDVPSPTRISCRFPINGMKTGTWSIVVTNPDNQIGILVNGLTITDSNPVITRISPISGYNSGKLAATITGKNFKATSTVKLKKGSVTKTAIIQKITSTQITCTFSLTGAPAGKYTLQVLNTDGASGSKLQAFTVKAAGKKPTINSINPKVGLSSKNALVTITGSNFRRGAIIQMIKGKTIKKATIRSLGEKKVLCILPTKKAAAGLWNVMLTNVDGTSVTKTGGFTVKKATSELESGSDIKIVGDTQGSVPLLAVPSRGSSQSGGALVPINTPIANS